jgi:hypothetical protein
LILREIVGPWGENLVVMHREKPKRKNERTRLWFSCCSGDRGKICFGFENRDGKGSVLLKVGGRERV